MTKQNDKLILKIFDGNIGEPKRPHNCNICQIYKREIAKGNTDAMLFYREHINEFVKKYNGATLVFNVKPKRKELPSTKKTTARVTVK